jgi:hypothetical protein
VRVTFFYKSAGYFSNHIPILPTLAFLLKSG